MTKFIKCWHPDVEGEASFAESSLPHQMAKGWSPVEPEPAEEPKSKSEAKRIDTQSKAKKVESSEE